MLWIKNSPATPWCASIFIHVLDRPFDSENSVFWFREIFLNNFINNFFVFIYSLFRTHYLHIEPSEQNLLSTLPFSHLYFLFYFLRDFLKYLSSKLFSSPFTITVLISKSSFLFSECFQIVSCSFFSWHYILSLKSFMRFLSLFEVYFSACLTPVYPSCFVWLF